MMEPRFLEVMDVRNSESTLLIANKKDYLSYPGRHTTVHKHNQIVNIKKQLQLKH